MESFNSKNTLSDNLQRHQGCSLLSTGMKNAFSEAQYVTLSLFSEKPPSIFALCRSLSLPLAPYCFSQSVEFRFR